MLNKKIEQHNHDNIKKYTSTDEHGHANIYEIINHPQLKGISKVFIGAPFTLEQLPGVQDCIIANYKKFDPSELANIQAYLLLLLPENFPELLKELTLFCIPSTDVDKIFREKNIHPENATDTNLVDALLDWILALKTLEEITNELKK
jgi:hypothetical protein